MKLLIIGYGKMGKAIKRIAPQYGFSDFVIMDNEEDWIIKQNEIKKCKIAIEFSTPKTVLTNLSRCFELQIPVICGTTGWGEQKEDLLKIWRNRSISFIYGSNFSIGANIFFKLNEWLAQQMKNQSQYEVSIEETHHIHKKDFPSGTALNIEKNILSQFQNITSISINSIRKGEVVGDHLVKYESAEDIIQVKHSAISRDIFARGALKAAVWLMKNPGIYNFEEIFEEV